MYGTVSGRLLTTVLLNIQKSAFRTLSLNVVLGSRDNNFPFSPFHQRGNGCGLDGSGAASGDNSPDRLSLHRLSTS